jgi:hypothetical protein
VFRFVAFFASLEIEHQYRHHRVTPNAKGNIRRRVSRRLGAGWLRALLSVRPTACGFPDRVLVAKKLCLKSRHCVGPVENIGGKLMLRIPLAAGGSELAECARGISESDGEFLCIHIMDWLAEKLGISEGDEVLVDNANGKFNIRAADDNDAG